MKKIMQG